MTQEPGGQDRESAGVQLSRLLRRWWEEAGSPTGGTRPTQQALAARLGVDQTTLSRYLNPKHLSTAPLRVVEALHAQLRVPAAELEQARALCRTALQANARPRTPGGRGEHAAPAGTASEPDGITVPDGVPGKQGAVVDRDTDGWQGFTRIRARRFRPVLVAVALVVAFAAGVAFRDRLAAQDSAATVDGAAGAAPQSGARYEWPLLRMGNDDKFTRGRALQNLLNAQGYKLRADGIFREDTRKAVEDFQEREELPIDGKVGMRTWPALVKEGVGPGSNAFAVRAVQELLNYVGQGATPVTGTYTSVTVQNVKTFQVSQGLHANGRVDEDTLLALLVKQLPPVSAPDYQRSTTPPSPASE
ncbi:peptidoglycan-binding protein [Actinacidiphila glaucinigra]|uniref:peptidoglycan-binding protein n=1 Tax=Actinacidiphila glaucinigra TaxID=235986 RepID=UPI0035E2093D